MLSVLSPEAQDSFIEAYRKLANVAASWEEEIEELFPLWPQFIAWANRQCIQAPAMSQQRSASLLTAIPGSSQGFASRAASVSRATPMFMPEPPQSRQVTPVTSANRAAPPPPAYRVKPEPVTPQVSRVAERGAVGDDDEIQEVAAPSPSKRVAARVGNVEVCVVRGYHDQFNL